MKILDRLPLQPESRSVRFGDRHVAFHRDSAIVWLSVGLAEEDDPRRVAPPFPALLDTGNNAEAYLHERHLVDWAGIRPAALAVLGHRTINAKEVPLREASLWIHPNAAGSFERSTSALPYRLELRDGIAVAPSLPDQPVAPRVPLLGLPALRNNNLDFWFDSASAHCHLRTSDWRSRIIRLLARLP